MRLTRDQINEIDCHVQRAGAANCWTGTSGSLAADARALIKHIRETSMDAYPADHILRGEQELRGVDEIESRKTASRLAALDEALADDTPAGPSAAVRLLDTARAAVTDRHAVYGPPQEHFARTVGMVNALFAGVLRRPLTTADWARIMLLDKLARDLGPRPHPDNAVDLAGYAACLAECQSAPPPG